MRMSFGLGTIRLVFKDQPAIAAHYIKHLDVAVDEGSFNVALGGPIHRVTAPEEVGKLVQDYGVPDIFRVHPASPDYYEYVVLNNNSGGPTFVIPKDFLSADQINLLSQE